MGVSPRAASRQERWLPHMVFMGVVVRIAIMQPYFLPYAGYFRLMAGVDAFVVLDDVQFPRGGWVHRNKLARMDGPPAWLTMPLMAMPTHTPIRDMRFHARAGEFWHERLRRFPACTQPNPTTLRIVEELTDTGPGPADSIVRLLRITADLLGYRPAFIQASELAIPASLGRTRKLIAICQLLGATSYINAPNGRDLYAPADFAARGIRLEFLPVYQGNPLSILQRLHDESVSTICREIEANLL